MYAPAPVIDPVVMAIFMCSRFPDEAAGLAFVDALAAGLALGLTLALGLALATGLAADAGALLDPDAELPPHAARNSVIAARAVLSLIAPQATRQKTRMKPVIRKLKSD